MNELLAPIYYVFAGDASGSVAARASYAGHCAAMAAAANGDDGDSSCGGGRDDDGDDADATYEYAFRANAEADAFFCFCAVMAERRDLFIKRLDDAPTGVMTRVANLHERLRVVE